MAWIKGKVMEVLRGIAYAIILLCLYGIVTAVMS